MIIRGGSRTKLMMNYLNACFSHYPLLDEAGARLAWYIEQPGTNYDPAAFAELIVKCLTEAEPQISDPLPPPTRHEISLFVERAVLGFMHGSNYIWFVKGVMRRLDELFPTHL